MIFLEFPFTYTGVPSVFDQLCECRREEGARRSYHAERSPERFGSRNLSTTRHPCLGILRGRC